jgi:hypothetical protein
MKNPVWPWAIRGRSKHRFRGTVGVCRRITSLLKTRGFTLDWKESPALQKIYRSVLAGFSHNPPWLIVCSNSNQILREVEQFIPVVYSLTHHASVEVIHTAELIELCRARTPLNIWEDFPAGERLSELESTNFLLWPRYDMRVRDLPQYEAKIFDLLQTRVNRGNILLLTQYCPSWEITSSVISASREAIISSLGAQIAGMLHECSSTIILQGEDLSLASDCLSVYKIEKVR